MKKDNLPFEHKLTLFLFQAEDPRVCFWLRVDLNIRNFIAFFCASKGLHYAFFLNLGRKCVLNPLDFSKVESMEKVGKCNYSGETWQTLPQMGDQD